MVIMIAVVTGEMAGSDSVPPERLDASLGRRGGFSMRAKWRSPRRAGSSVLKKALDTPNIVRDGRVVGDAYKLPQNGVIAV